MVFNKNSYENKKNYFFYYFSLNQHIHGSKIYFSRSKNKIMHKIMHLRVKQPLGTIIENKSSHDSSDDLSDQISLRESSTSPISELENEIPADQESSLNLKPLKREVGQYVDISKRTFPWFNNQSASERFNHICNDKVYKKLEIAQY
jgi:hypothetical protein